MSAEAAPALLALRDRAYAFVLALGPVSEDALLTHVYGGAPPAALRARLAAPLLDDPRLERRPDGDWTAPVRRLPTDHAQLQALGLNTPALAASGAQPTRRGVV